MDAREESLTLLRSMDASLKALVKHFAGQAPKEVASDRDLDGKYGDEEIKLEPRDWTGPKFKGRRMSECPAAYLDLLAEMFDYMARRAQEKNELYNGKPTAPYKIKSAARARGWAKRVRAGLAPGAATSASMAGSEPSWPTTASGDDAGEPVGSDDIKW